MKFRRTMKSRRAVTAVAIATGLLVTVAGCGGGDGDKTDKNASSSAPSRTDGGKTEETESQPPAAEPALAEVKNGDITLAVTSAVRDQGGFVTVNGTVTNSGGDFWVAADWRGDERELSKNGASLAGAALVDSKAKKKYLVLRDTDGRCLCTKFEGGGVDTGQTTDWFAQFPAPPEDSTQVNLQVGTMPPASIEISEGE
ncbi:hypothetical protein GCM10023084_06620 [Streptomyces lacrimifluminis]|uniref:Lipoprotein n=1 Tax=Streptomyces lacrimifluminis TaxID=1500077 RepID=A0A917KUZ2_9ACTN|nr:hypothetical protein [Streptomyces lacrimifluminis]GGJ26071.1 hypothetical protein GCM10012282_23250 [Streptomyces lacrimifluminis]